MSPMKIKMRTLIFSLNENREGRFLGENANTLNHRNSYPWIAPKVPLTKYYIRSFSDIYFF